MKPRSLLVLFALLLAILVACAFLFRGEQPRAAARPAPAAPPQGPAPQGPPPEGQAAPPPAPLAPPPAAGPTTAGRALLVGVTEYPQLRAKFGDEGYRSRKIALQGPANDVRLMHDVLVD